MEWHSKVIRPGIGTLPLPFFMTYPGYADAAQEKTLLRDLEYLQQTYPNEVKRYQRKIADILDKFDYEGSMIYDEYPDKFSLQRLAETVTKILRQENQQLPTEEQLPTEKWEWLTDMILVLLCHEVYKRRHGGPRGYIWK